jgi:intron-binding protein aquarius
MGEGESEPAPGIYQNVGEAEYVVAVYQYMRILGYPADKIAIVTPFRAQRALIREILERRCLWNVELFGDPLFVGTVDEFRNRRADCKFIFIAVFTFEVAYFYRCFSVTSKNG